MTASAHEKQKQVVLVCNKVLIIHTEICNHMAQVFKINTI